MREGIAHHEQCVYIAEHSDDAQLNAIMSFGAPEIAVVGASDLDLGNGSAAERMIDWLRSMTDAAIRAGRSGVRVCQEVFGDHHSVEYECRLDELVQEQPLVSMCLYDRGRLPALVVHESFATHPLVWIHDVVCANPRYLPPERHRADDRLASEIAGILDQLYRDETVRQRSRGWLRATLAKVEAERAAIARALHDEIGQALVLVSLKGRNETIDDAIELVRAMARDLRSSTLDDLGLVAAVRGLTTREAMRGGLEIKLELTADDTKLASDTATACYRILEAALANVVDHARATTLAVALRDAGRTIELVVADNGVGIARGARAGLGLVDMEQRASLVGGELEIDSKPGAGTTVRLRAPR